VFQSSRHTDSLCCNLYALQNTRFNQVHSKALLALMSIAICICIYTNQVLRQNLCIFHTVCLCFCGISYNRLLSLKQIYWFLRKVRSDVVYAMYNRVLTRIFGPKWDEVTGEWRTLCNKKLYALYSTPTIIRVTSSEIGRACNRCGGKQRSIDG
jgi:hypothetical protein